VIHVVIPAFNEGDNIGRLVAELARRTRTLDARILVVDDGSTDGTAAAAMAQADVLAHPANRGLGAALRTGLGQALEGARDDDAIVTLEGDDTWDLDDLSLMLERFAAGADLVMASYFAPGGRLIGVPPWRAWGSRAVSAAFRHAGGLREFHQVTPLYRVYRAGALRRASELYAGALMREDGFAVNVELLIKLRAGGARIVEVPTTLDWTRRRGQSKLPVASTLAAYARLLAAHRRGRLRPTPTRWCPGAWT
jgi:dolichol-phosphate mannosyltransferase